MTSARRHFGGRLLMGVSLPCRRPHRGCTLTQLLTSAATPVATRAGDVGLVSTKVCICRPIPPCEPVKLHFRQGASLGNSPEGRSQRRLTRKLRRRIWAPPHARTMLAAALSAECAGKAGGRIRPTRGNLPDSPNLYLRTDGRTQAHRRPRENCTGKTTSCLWRPPQRRRLA